MTAAEKRITDPALIQALAIHFQHEAIERVAADALVPREQILSSRFVITNKGGPGLFKPKGRLCVCGRPS